MEVRPKLGMLLLLANFGKEGNPQPISPNISQETLAEMIGTTRSRVSHFMNKFRKLGLISYNGHIEVHNSLLSAVLHEKPQLKEDDWGSNPRSKRNGPSTVGELRASGLRWAKCEVIGRPLERCRRPHSLNIEK